MTTSDSRAAQMRLLAERFSRSLLSFLAPLVALLGVSLTNRMTNWFALPLSCLVLMSVNLLVRMGDHHRRAAECGGRACCRRCCCMAVSPMPYSP